MKTILPYSILAGVLSSIGSLHAETSSAKEVLEKETHTPTRLIIGDVDEHLVALRAKLAINSQERGPFGFLQNPDEEQVPLFNIPEKVVKSVDIPFTTVINSLSISAVMPSEGRFMVGARELRVGQVLPLEAGGKMLRIRIEAVKTSEVVFRNLADNTLATKRLDLLPDGVRPGGGSITVDGVTPTDGGAEEPLYIDLQLPPGVPDE